MLSGNPSARQARGLRPVSASAPSLGLRYPEAAHWNGNPCPDTDPGAAKLLLSGEGHVEEQTRKTRKTARDRERERREWRMFVFEPAVEMMWNLMLFVPTAGRRAPDKCFYIVTFACTYI